MPRNNADPADEQFESITVWLRANRPEVPPMPPGFKAALGSRLAIRHAEHQGYYRYIRVSLSGVAAIMIVGLFLWLATPRLISAAEIVSRANLAATDATAFGLKSYSGTKTTWLRDSGISVEQGRLTANLQEHIWAQMPNSLYDEWYSYPPGSQISSGLPENSEIAAPTHDPSMAVDLNAIVVNDGSSVWWYDIAGKYATQHDPRILFFPLFAKKSQSSSSDFQSLLKDLSKAADNVTQLAPEMVAGRETYVLSFTPKSGVSSYAFTAQIKVWIDRQTYFELGREYRDKQGLILQKWVYSKFEPNVAISPELFHFTPPSGVLVVDTRRPKDEAALADDWWSVALSADYKVFRPTLLPSGLIMERPYYGVMGGYSDGFTQLEQDFYTEGGQSPAFILFEDKYAGQLSSVTGMPVKIGQYDGEYYEENGRRMLQINQDNTWIFLQTDQQLMTTADLFQVAQTLMLVPKVKPVN